MKRMLPTVNALFCLAAVLILAQEAKAAAITLTNPGFNPYKPGSSTITGTLNVLGSAGWTNTVGQNVAVASGVAQFSNATTGNVVDILGWTGTGSASIVGAHTDVLGENRIITYAGVYSATPYDGTLSQTLTGVTAQANSVYTLSADLSGVGGGPNVTYQIFFGSTPISAVGSNTWTQAGSPEAFTATFQTGGAPISGDLQVLFTFAGTGTSKYTLLDNVSLSVNPVPEPASLALLALGAVAILRRRR